MNAILKNKLFYFTLFFFPWSLFRTNFYYDLNFIIKLLISIIITIISILFMKFLFLFSKYFKFISEKFLFTLSFCIFLELSVIEFDLIYLRFFILILAFIFVFKFYNNHKIIYSIIIFSISFVFLIFIKGNYIFLKKNFYSTKETNHIQYNFRSELKKKGLIVIFLDELSSLTYYNNSDEISKNYIKNFRDVFEKYKFNIIDNSFSNYSETTLSLTSILNFKNNFENESLEKNFFRKNIFIEIIKNQLFNSWEGDIRVYQNSAVILCNKKNLIFKTCKTETHIPVPNTREFLVTNSSFKFLYDKIYYFIHYELKKKFPEVFYYFYLKNNSKVFFEDNLNNIIADKKIINNDNSLILIHALTPHKPLIYLENCTNGFIDNDELTLKQKDYYHAVEINCLAKIFDKFFYNLKNNEILDNVEIIITSDHGNRHKNDFASRFSTFFAYRGSVNLELETGYYSIQNLIPYILFENFTFNDISNEFVYDNLVNKLIKINP